MSDHEGAYMPSDQVLARLAWVQRKVGLSTTDFVASLPPDSRDYRNVALKSRTSGLMSAAGLEVLAKKIETVYGIRAEWILTGEGNAR